MNIVTKTIFHEHVKTLKVLQALLERIQHVDEEDDQEFAKVTHSAVAEFEANDTTEELFRRRMGLRTYLMKLKMSLVRVRNSKRIREQIKASEGEDGLTSTLDEISPKEASALVEAQKKVGATAAVTNPAPKTAKKKGSAKGATKKKAVAG